MLSGSELSYYKAAAPGGVGGGAAQRVIDIREYSVGRQTLPRTPGPLLALTPLKQGGVPFLMYADAAAGGTAALDGWVAWLEAAQRGGGAAGARA